MSRTLLVLFALSYAKVPPPDATPDEVLRGAVAAARAGNLALADTLLNRCEEHASDPGLVAFNRATILFEAGDYREAELHYLRCLDDRAIPAERRVQALYNRGVCLLHRGEDAKLLRVAIGCFEQCLDAAGGPLAKDARHNLELAKLLWAKARASQKDPPKPSEFSEPDPPPVKPTEAPSEEIGPDSTPQAGRTPAGSQTAPQPSPGTNPMPNTTPQQTPGAGTAPVVRGDASAVEKLSPADTELLLDKTDARLRNARQKNEQMRAGPERPNVRDW